MANGDGTHEWRIVVLESGVELLGNEKASKEDLRRCEDRTTALEGRVERGVMLLVSNLVGVVLLLGAALLNFFSKGHP